MASSIVVETDHQEMIHDAQMDFFGKRLATASSDRTIKVFEVAGEQQRLLQELKGHDGPVWQVAWSHPQYGNLLASCSYDGNVIVWKEEQSNRWGIVMKENVVQSSVNSVAWAPHTYGLMLAAACSDGSVSIHTYQESAKQWSSVRFPAHAGGVNAVSWGPDVRPGDLLMNAPAPGKRLVTGGCDNEIKIWSLNEQTSQWEQQRVIETDSYHQDWVRDVAWSPSVGLPVSTIASCSEDKTVIIWSENRGVWRKAKTIPFEHKVWRVSWSIMGNILAVAQGDNRVSLWKEALDGEWQNLSTMSEADSEAQEAKSDK